MAFFVPETHDFSAQSSTELIVKTDPTLRFECENANYPYNEYAIVSWDPNRPINFTVKCNGLCHHHSRRLGIYFDCY